MKYIAIFDVPDGYGIGAAIAKIATKGKETYCDSDFEDCYAQVEPLSEQKAEVFERFNTVERVLQNLGIGCAYDMPSFWTHERRDYKVIPTKFHKGYMQALEDVEKDIRYRFGFAERDNIMYVPPFDCGAKMDGEV